MQGAQACEVAAKKSLEGAVVVVEVFVGVQREHRSQSTARGVLLGVHNTGDTGVNEGHGTPSYIHVRKSPAASERKGSAVRCTRCEVTVGLGGVVGEGSGSLLTWGMALW